MKRWCLFLVLAALTAGCRQEATGPPVSEISLGADAPEARLLRGFYEPTGAWRWTAPEFAVTLDPPDGDEPVFVELDFTLPSEVTAAHSSVTLSATVNGVAAGSKTYDHEGRYIFSMEAPGARRDQRPAEVMFRVSPGTTVEGREAGIIVVSAALREQSQSAGVRAAEMVQARRDYEKILEERDVAIPVEKQREFMRLFHELDVWDHLWFHGVPIIKNPLDLWMMQQIFYEVRPDFVIETGTWKGGSALYWAHTLNGLGLTHSRVLTVDVNDQTAEASTHDLWKQYVEFFVGSSTDPAIVDKIRKQVAGGTVLVTLDSDHSRDHVLEELRLYAPMVTPGSYLVVEDTHLDGIPTHPEQGPGPMAAVRAFLAEGGSKDFEQDFTREALVMTFNPGGWLRRK